MRHLTTILLLCCLCLTQGARAQGDATARYEQLQKEMYRLFPSRDTEGFTSVTEQLKELAKERGDERMFYKAWGNQAMFDFRVNGRAKGLATGQAVYDYAKRHDNKFGLYSATYAIASMQNSMKMFDVAEKSFKECINYLKLYFPDESTSPCYLQLAKIYHNQNRIADEGACAEQVLTDKNATPLNILTAWSFKCFMNSPDNGSHRDEFIRCWAEREKAKAAVGHDDSYGHLLNIDYALFNDNYDEALRLVDALSSPLDRLTNISRVYKAMGNYEKAYEAYQQYIRMRDSLNNIDARRLSTEYSVQMDVARAESEAKDLRLANQSLQLTQVESELRQRELEAEAADLKLKNQDAELANATMQLEKATLDGMAREMEYRERLSKIEAEHHATRASKLSERYIYAIIAIILLALGYIIIHHRFQVRKLKGMNEQLQTAYDRLEQTTTVKERIESELRIARDIQMSMVPSVFPDRDDLDFYAFMSPAKEVGGDLYSYVLHGDRLHFCIGDVSGKGVPASLFMAQTTRLFRTLAAQHLMPSDIANQMNSELSDHNDQGMFVTMFIGLIDLQTGSMDFVNCGHNPPVLDKQFMKVEPNAPIGLWPELDFEGERIMNIRHKRLFLYTDGITEAEDCWQTQFGERAMLSMLHGHTSYTSRQTVEMMKDAVTEHAGGAAPSDDITMMCIKVI